MERGAINSDMPMPSGARSRTVQLRELTGKVAGTVFFGTLLKSMRESTMNGPYGHGGRGEEVFAERLHGILAQRIGTRMKDGLSESLYRALRPQQERIDVIKGCASEGAT